MGVALDRMRSDMIEVMRKMAPVCASLAEMPISRDFIRILVHHARQIPLLRARIGFSLQPVQSKRRQMQAVRSRKRRSAIFGCLIRPEIQVVSPLEAVMNPTQSVVLPQPGNPRKRENYGLRWIH